MLTKSDRIRDLGLLKRTFNAVEAAGFRTIGDLVSQTRTDLIGKIRMLSPRSIDTLIDVLERNGFSITYEGISAQLAAEERARCALAATSFETVARVVDGKTVFADCAAIEPKLPKKRTVTALVVLEVRGRLTNKAATKHLNELFRAVGRGGVVGKHKATARVTDVKVVQS